MADQIKHDAKIIVGSNGSVADTGLPDVISGATVAGSATNLLSVTVDDKGRVTTLGSVSKNVSGVTFANTNGAGVASSSFAHAADQKIHISSSAPANNSIGNNGDIWYQTLN
tara:strand:+ start:746 stop:1081 length:336 start_codon:yes stop_codon:yes gene_type:complete